MLVERASHQLSPSALLPFLCASWDWESLREHLRSPCPLRQSIRWRMLALLRLYVLHDVRAHLVLFRLFLVALGATEF